MLIDRLRFINRRRLVAASAVATAALAAWIWVEDPFVARRPQYIYINETSDRSHDLDFKILMKLMEQRSGVENALALLERLPRDKTIEEVAVEIFDRWKIGGTRSGKGILYVYSKEENLFKIEVSYALEGIIPDVICHRLERSAQTYLLSEVPERFFNEVLLTMNLRAAGEITERETALSPPPWLTNAYLSGGAGVKTRGYSRTLEDYEAVVRRAPDASLEQFQPSANPEETVSRYLKSLEMGIGDPQLPLITSGSQISRVIVPRSEEHMRRLYDYLRQALPYQLVTSGRFGVVVFEPVKPNKAIVLRLGENGLWYVDEVKAFNYFWLFGDANDFYPKFQDLPVVDALRQTRAKYRDKPLYKSWVQSPYVLPYPVQLKEVIGELEQKIRDDPGNAALYAALGDVYFFEMNWLSKALEMYEEAARLAPARLDFRWRLYDLYLNAMKTEKSLTQLEFLAQNMPHDPDVQAWHRFYRSAYDFKPGEFGPSPAK